MVYRQMIGSTSYTDTTRNNEYHILYTQESAWITGLLLLSVHRGDIDTLWPLSSVPS